VRLFLPLFTPHWWKLSSVNFVRDCHLSICLARIRRDTFGRARSFNGLHRIRNEPRDVTVFHVADPDAAFPARMGTHGVGLGVGDVNVILGVDKDAARPTELRPLLDKVSFLIENLDAIVISVGDE
jgi:hypothetical protein